MNARTRFSRAGIVALALLAPAAAGQTGRSNEHHVLEVPQLIAGSAASAEQATAPGIACPLVDPAQCQVPDRSGHGTLCTLGAVSDWLYQSVDDFVPQSDDVITEVCWLGFYVNFAGPDDCGFGAGPDAFTISYYLDDDSGTLPGTLLAGPFDVGAASRAPTGVDIPSEFGHFVEYEYSASHPPVAVDAGTRYWIEIVNDNSSDACRWLWETAPAGNGRSARTTLPQEVRDFDLGWCLNTQIVDLSRCQLPNQAGQSGVVAVTSDLNPGITARVADDIVPQVDGTISEVRWWGAYAEFGQGDCGPGAVPDDFTITYYFDDGSQTLPGALWAAFNLGVVAKTPTGLTIPSGFGPLTEYVYSATHPPVAFNAGQRYWVEIVNDSTGSNCYWAWEVAPPGNGRAAQDVDDGDYEPGEELTHDVAWCVDLPVTEELCQPDRGACCNPVGGTCADDVAEPDCPEPLAFTPDTTCAELVPPCGGCQGVADCADTDGDGVRDDPCVSWACVQGACQSTPRTTQADMGGFSGDCALDGTCDINDRFHAQNCFANVDTDTFPPYPCEPAPPSAMNVDAVGFSGTCVLDGICDINDAFAANNCFANVGTDEEPPFPCGCGGPGPARPGSRAMRRPAPVASCELTLRAPRSARPGDVVEMDVYMSGSVERLQGYQLDLAVGGGAQGRLQLVDITVEAGRRDYVYGSTGPASWMSFNRQTAQMLNGLDEPAKLPHGQVYLATYVYEVSPDARGTFTINIEHDSLSPVPAGRTFFFETPYRVIDVGHATPAVIKVKALATKAP